MWKRFKLAWHILFGVELRIDDLKGFLSLFPDEPMAKVKKNLGQSFLVEFVVKVPRPKTRKMWTW